jgi:hypothetical protein
MEHFADMPQSLTSTRNRFSASPELPSQLRELLPTHHCRSKRERCRQRNSGLTSLLVGVDDTRRRMVRSAGVPVDALVWVGAHLAGIDEAKRVPILKPLVEQVAHEFFTSSTSRDTGCRIRSSFLPLA